ncbi:MAG: DinB family protein [Bacteroidia bacterium]
MFPEILTEFFERDLLKMKVEIESYPDENKLWIIKEGISNSGGNLCLHIIGNLKHFIGVTLSNTGYVRQRDDEFALKNIARSELLKQLDATIAVVNKTLPGLSEKDLIKNYPLEKYGKTVTTGYMLLHLLAHLNYHLGQVNYHRRLVS